MKIPADAKPDTELHKTHGYSVDGDDRWTVACPECGEEFEYKAR